MGERRPIVNEPTEMGVGDGYLFFGGLNSIFLQKELNCIGAVKGSFEFAVIDETKELETGSPMRVVGQEPTRKGCTLKVNFMELSAKETFLRYIGQGTLSETDETFVEFSGDDAQEVILYSCRMQKLPFENIAEITLIEDDNATPTTWDPEAIATNFEIDLAKGLIRIKRADEGGTISGDEVGQTYHLTGRYIQPPQDKLAIDSGATRNYYPLEFRVPLNNGKMRIHRIYKAYTLDRDPLIYGPEEEWVAGVTFRSCFDPCFENEYEIIGEFGRAIIPEPHYNYHVIL